MTRKLVIPPPPGRARLEFRPVVPGDAGGVMVPPDFDRSVNPISTRRAETRGRYITSGNPDF